MVFHGQLAVGLFDVVVGGVLGHAEDVVEIALGHGKAGSVQGVAGTRQISKAWQRSHAEGVCVCARACVLVYILYVFVLCPTFLHGRLIVRDGIRRKI